MATIVTLDSAKIALLVAVRQGRVHYDPRYTAPDFEKEPDPPFWTKRATQRLRPLKKWELVELVEDEADQFGVCPYRLTEIGELLLDEALAAEAAENDGPGALA